MEFNDAIKNKKSSFQHALAIIIISFLPALAGAQEKSYISGKVTEERSGAPIPNCSVYFNNTSRGDITSASGEFLLKNLPAGKYDLIVSAIGYQTAVIPVVSSDYPHGLQVQLQTLTTDLSEVVLKPAIENGWVKWGQTFLDNLIGTTYNARYCRLVNKNVVKFWFSESQNKLTARADEALVIENAALGYTLKFKLEDFILDLNSQSLFFSGYPFFEELSGATDKKRQEWIANRKDAFYGSIMHFIRCIYNGQWSEAGYRLMIQAMLPNIEKMRVKTILSIAKKPAVDSLSNVATRDTARYYKRVMRQSDSIARNVLVERIDSLLTDRESDKSFFFTGKMRVLYKQSADSKEQQSEIFLFTPEAITIEENGSYLPPKELTYSGYWGRTGRIANLLPLDYQP